MSEAVFTPAQESQQQGKIASNGSLALAAWSDLRDGVNRVYATRVDATGKAIDPFGIPIIAGAVAAVVWNGSEFIVVCSTDMQQSGVGHTQFAFVTVDGTISHRVATGRSLAFGASTANGKSVRMLFFEWPPALPMTKLTAVVVDGQGEVVTPSFTVVATNDTSSRVVAARGSEFLVLARTGGMGSGVSAIRISDAGEVAGVAASRIPIDFPFSDDLMIGGNDGYLYANGISAYQLDANGVFTGIVTTLIAGTGLRPSALAVDGDRYIVAASGQKATYLGEIREHESSITLKQVAGWPQFVYGLGLAWTGGQHVLLTSAFGSSSSGADLFAQRIAPTLDADDPHPIAFTATQQGNAHVAFSSYGYAVTFSENGPDDFMHHYLRRFSASGTPIDAAPIEIARNPTPSTVPFYPYFTDTRIVSNGERYLVAWEFYGVWRVRRMAAATGEWIDESALPVVFTDIVLAANGRDVLATYRDGNDASLHCRRIRMTGAALLDRDFIIATPAIEQAVASNGTDYLVVWIDAASRGTVGVSAPVPPGPASSFRVLGKRVGADGVPIDATPLSISDGPAGSPAVGATERGYIVIWPGRIARVTNEGGAGREASIAQGGTPTIVSLGHDYVVLFANGGTSDVPEMTWSAMRFNEGVSLAEIAALTATPVVTHESWRFGSVSAASDAQHLVLAYDDVSGATLGHITRVITREFADPVARRRTIAH